MKTLRQLINEFKASVETPIQIADLNHLYGIIIQQLNLLLTPEVQGTPSDILQIIVFLTYLLEEYVLQENMVGGEIPYGSFVFAKERELESCRALLKESLDVLQPSTVQRVDETRTALKKYELIEKIKSIL